jgi:DNA-binding FadR family transcriptional regulator
MRTFYVSRTSVRKALATSGMGLVEVTPRGGACGAASSQMAIDQSAR